MRSSFFVLLHSVAREAHNRDIYKFRVMIAQGIVLKEMFVKEWHSYSYAD